MAHDIAAGNGHSHEAAHLLAPDNLFRDLVSLISTSSSRVDTLELVTPLTGESFMSLPACSVDDVQSAFERARRAQTAWAQTPLAHRIRLVDRFANLVLERREMIMDVIQIETGKTRLDALEETMDVVVTSAYYAARVPGWQIERHHRGAVPWLTGARSRPVPRGVVAAISPWNYPFTLFPSDAMPALLAGNAVVAKPAEETSLTALMALLLFREAGFPADLIQILIGRGDVLGPAMIEQSDFVQFTGSTQTGRAVAEAAGRSLVPVSLELGGKNAMIVLDDASIEDAVSGAIKGCFANAGQLCIAFERLFIHDSVYERFRERFIQRTRRLRLGSGNSFENDVGSLVSQKHLEHVTEHVRCAGEHGALILTGGHHRPDVGPYFFEPTVLENVAPASKAYAEETFGPVVSIYSVSSAEEAIVRANDSHYGLHASVWSANIERARRVAEVLHFGTIAINEAYLGMWGSTGAPMGGTKMSGIGRRHGIEGYLKYTEPRSVIVQRGLPLAPSALLQGEQFARLVEFLARLRRTAFS